MSRAKGGQVTTEDGLLYSRTTAIRSRKAEDQVNTAGLRKLNGDTRLRRWSLQKISLFEQFHLPAHLVHKGGAFNLRRAEQRLFGGLPIVSAQQRNR